MGKSKLHPSGKNAYERFFPTPQRVLDAIEKDDIEGLRRNLTPRQVKFCDEYVLDFNATNAARRAGYSPNGIQKQSSQLLHHKGCRYLIDHLTKSKEAKITSVDPDYIVTRILDIVNKDGAKDGDKLRGLELLARHLGMLRDKTEISGPDGGAIETLQRVKEESSAVVNALRSMSRKATRLQVVGGRDVEAEEDLEEEEGVRD